MCENPAESGFYYLKSRYYDPAICRFINADGLASTGQGFLGCNMFAYCGNNPVMSVDISGTMMVSAVSRDDGDGISRLIQFDVPLYYQGSTNLCWAYCMVMRKSYDEGRVLSKQEADQAAKELGIEYHSERNWNKGLPFFRQGSKVRCKNIDDLYIILINYGPVYAAYRYKNIIGGHIVLVTGVDLDNGIIYTNNPWKVYGIQTEDDFRHGFVNEDGELEPGYWLSGIYIPVG